MMGRSRAGEDLVELSGDDQQSVLAAEAELEQIFLDL
jgi:hypothetical protein